MHPPPSTSGSGTSAAGSKVSAESQAKGPEKGGGKNATTSAIERMTDRVFDPMLGVLTEIGNILILMGNAFMWLFRRPFRWRQYLMAMEYIGVDSLPVIVLVGTFVGAAFSLQTVAIFRIFQAEGYIGSTVAVALCRELAPVLAAVMLTARAVSAMATELGSMRITEQIDALETLAVSPIQFLVCPRIVASVVMLPLLTVVFGFVGIVGAYVVAVIMMHVDEGSFIANLDWILDADDIIQGMVKAAFFGLSISAIGCYQGYNAKGGAKGVGIATTRAVVQSCVCILVLDYFLTDILFAVET